MSGIGLCFSIALENGVAQVLMIQRTGTTTAFAKHLYPAFSGDNGRGQAAQQTANAK